MPNRLPDDLREALETFIKEERPDLEQNGEQQRHPRCVLSKRGAANALGLKSEGGSALWRTLSRQNIGSEIDEKLREKIDNPIVFKYISTGSESGSGNGPGVTVHGIETTTFVEILRVILKAKLTASGLGCGDGLHEARPEERD